MKTNSQRNAPGQVRDAIFDAFAGEPHPLSISEIHRRVVERIGAVPESSIRSYLLLNTPSKFRREGRGRYALQGYAGMLASAGQLEREPDSVAEGALAEISQPVASFRFGSAELFHQDCFDWLADQSDRSIHAVVTDPPYGIKEYTPEELEKLRAGHGGVWRMPPALGGSRRSPLPRFTVLDRSGLEGLRAFFLRWGRAVLPKLVPGANVVMASNPLLSSIVSEALAEAGLERRGELVRLTMTMRGGDRPKNAEAEFDGVSVMPRSMWEPWLLFRRPLEGRVQDNLRKWGTGGFRRIGPDKPFGDVIKSAPTNRTERLLANHPSLKPQAFLRKVVRASLPLGRGCVVDPFAGSGSTLAAAEAVGYESRGAERDEAYFRLACEAIPRLRALPDRDEEDATASARAKAVVRRNPVRPSGPDTATLPLVF